MSWLSIGDHLVVFCLVFVLWTLSHQNSGGTEPLKRTISLGYGVSALLVLATLMVEDFAENETLEHIFNILSRVALTVALCAVSYRLRQIYKHQ